MDIDKLKLLHDNLRGRYNIGDFDTFRDAMTDGQRRHAFYNKVSETHNIGESFGEFEEALGAIQIEETEPREDPDPSFIEPATWEGPSLTRLTDAALAKLQSEHEAKLKAEAEALEQKRAKEIAPSDATAVAQKPVDILRMTEEEVGDLPLKPPVFTEEAEQRVMMVLNGLKTRQVREDILARTGSYGGVLTPQPEEEPETLGGMLKRVLFRQPLEAMADPIDQEAIAHEIAVRIARTQGTDYEVAKAEVLANFRKRAREEGYPIGPGTMEILSLPIMLGIGAGLSYAPKATLMGIGKFMTLDELDNVAANLMYDRPYAPFGGGSAITEFMAPEGSPQSVRDVADVFGFMLKAGVVGGGPKLWRKMTHDVVKYRTPHLRVSVSPKRIKGLVREGKMSLADEADLAKFLGMKSKGTDWQRAIKEGLVVEFPTINVVKMTQKPWYRAVKKAIAIGPLEHPTKTTMTFKGRPVGTFQTEWDSYHQPYRAIPPPNVTGEKGVVRRAAREEAAAVDKSPIITPAPPGSFPGRKPVDAPYEDINAGILDVDAKIRNLHATEGIIEKSNLRNDSKAVWEHIQDTRSVINQSVHLIDLFKLRRHRIEAGYRVTNALRTIQEAEEALRSGDTGRAFALANNAIAYTHGTTKNFIQEREFERAGISLPPDIPATMKGVDRAVKQSIRYYQELKESRRDDYKDMLVRWSKSKDRVAVKYAERVLEAVEGVSPEGIPTIAETEIVPGSPQDSEFWASLKARSDAEGTTTLSFTNTQGKETTRDVRITDVQDDFIRVSWSEKTDKGQVTRTARWRKSGIKVEPVAKVVTKPEKKAPAPDYIPPPTDADYIPQATTKARAGPTQTVERLEAYLDPLFKKAGIRLDIYPNVESIPSAFERESAERTIKSGYHVMGQTMRDRSGGHLIADQIHSLRDAERTAIEEIFHIGVFQTLGNDYAPFMDMVAEKYPAEVKSYRDRGWTDPRMAAEEVLGDHVDKDDLDTGLWERLRFLFKKWLRKLGSKIQWSDKDIKGLFASALRKARQARPAEPLDRTPMAQKAGEWYSKFREVIQTKMPAKGTVGQFQKILDSWKKKGFFREEEMSWFMEDSPLETRKGDARITAKELLAHIDENMPRLIVRSFGRGPFLRWEDHPDKPNTFVATDRSGGQYTITRVEDANLDLFDPARAASTYYVVQYPEGSFERFSNTYDAVAGAQRVARENAPETGTALYQDKYVAPGPFTDYREDLVYIGTPGREFMGHFGEPRFRIPAETPDEQFSLNFHIRSTERQTTEGTPTRHLDELQSDLRRSGRLFGYTKSLTLKDKAALQAEAEQLNQELVNVFEKAKDLVKHPYLEGMLWYDPVEGVGPHGQQDVPSPDEIETALEKLFYGMGQVEDPTMFTPAEKELIRTLHAELNRIRAAKQENLARRSPSTNVPPDVPHKKKWPLLGLKVFLRQAAMDGYEKVTFTSGEQVADLYDLRTYGVEEITYNPVEEELTALHGEGHELAAYSVSLDKLDQYVEKKIANDLRSQAEDFAGLRLEDYADAFSIEVVEDPSIPRTTYTVEDAYGGVVTDELATFEEAEDYIEGLVRELMQEDYSQMELPSVTGTDLAVGGEWAINLYNKQLINEANKYVKKWGTKVEWETMPFGEETRQVASLTFTPQMIRDLTGKPQPLFSLKQRFIPGTTLEGRGWILPDGEVHVGDPEILHVEHMYDLDDMGKITLEGGTPARDWDPTVEALEKGYHRLSILTDKDTGKNVAEILTFNEAAIPKIQQAIKDLPTHVHTVFLEVGNPEISSSSWKRWMGPRALFLQRGISQEPSYVWKLHNTAKIMQATKPVEYIPKEEVPEIQSLAKIHVDRFPVWPRSIKKTGRDFWMWTLWAARTLGPAYRYKNLHHTLFGTFDPSKPEGEIRLHDIRDVLTATHEIGHDIDWLLNKKNYPGGQLAISKRFPGTKYKDRELRAELEKISRIMRPTLWKEADENKALGKAWPRSYLTRHTELLADFISHYILSPRATRRKAPKMTEELVRKMAKNKEVLNAIAIMHMYRNEGYKEPPIAKDLRKAFKIPSAEKSTLRLVDKPGPLKFSSDRDLYEGVKFLGLMDDRHFKALYGATGPAMEKIQQLVPEESRHADLMVLVEGPAAVRQVEALRRLAARRRNPAKKKALTEWADKIEKGNRNPYTGETYESIKKRGTTKEEDKAMAVFEAWLELDRQYANMYKRTVGEAEYIRFLEHFAPHLYERPFSTKTQGGVSRWLKFTQSRRHRVLPTLGLAVDLGLVPRVRTLHGALEGWANINFRAAINSAFLTTLARVHGPEGLPVIMDPNKADQLKLRWPQVHYKHIQKYIVRPQKGKRIIISRSNVVAVHPEIKWLMDGLFAEAPNNKVARLLQAANYTAKAFELTLLSGFHHQAEWFSAAGALGWRVLPFVGGFYGKQAQKFGAKYHIGILKAGRTLIDIPEFKRDMQLAGLQFGRIHTEGINQMEKMLRSLENHLATIVGKQEAGAWKDALRFAYMGAKGVRKTYGVTQSLLWDNVDNVKAITYMKIVTDGIRKTDLPIHKIKEVAAQYANRNYGGLEWYNTVFRDPRVIWWLSQSLLSPDWTLAQLQTFGGLFEGVTLEAKNLLKAGKIDPRDLNKFRFSRSIYRKHWRRYIATVLLTTIIANYILSGKFPWENEHGHEWDVDYTNVYDAMPWNKDRYSQGDYARRYIALGKAGREIPRWGVDIHETFVPLRSMGHKSSPVARYLGEVLFGHQLGSDFPMPWEAPDLEGYQRATLIWKGAMEKLKPYSFGENNALLSFPMRKGMTHWKAIRAHEDLLFAKAKVAMGGIRGKTTKLHYTLWKGTPHLEKQIAEACKLNNVNYKKARREAEAGVKAYYYSKFWRSIKANSMGMAENYAKALFVLGVRPSGVIKSGRARAPELPEAVIKFGRDYYIKEYHAWKADRATAPETF